MDQPPNELDHESVSSEELWDDIGFHKPIAGFWYSLGFKLISLVLTIIISGFLLNYFYPFPESVGYRTTATGIFSLFFTIFDLGTHMTMDRYIAESRIKNPEKMIQYIQYFIWYQMITGLIQTTSVSLYALYFVPKTELSYAVWIMLIHSTTQYPGFLGVFRGVLGSLQQYNKTEVLNFISGEVFQRITELGFVLLGRMYGEAHPEIGALMGVALGSVIGLYVDDFFATLLSAYYFSRIMKKEGITIRMCFGHDFDKELVKETLIFGVKTGLPALTGVVSSLIMLYEFIYFIPQYTTFETLSGLASGIAGLVNWGVGCPASLIAEAYLNDKKELTKYYIAQSWRYAFMFQMFLLSAIMALYIVLERAFIAFEMFNYVLAIPFIIPWVVRHLQQPYTSLGDTMLLGMNHPNFLMFIRLLEEVLKIFFMTLWVVWLRLPQLYGIDALIWIMPCGIYIPIMIKTISIYIYVNRKIFTLKFALWQTFVAPILAGLVVYFLDITIIGLILNPLEAAFTFLPAAIISIIMIVLILILGYFPLTAIFGGWDDDNLDQFKKAAIMSGPSKFMVWPMYKLTEWTCSRSKLHNRFQLTELSENAKREAAELLILKNSHRVEYQENP